MHEETVGSKIVKWVLIGVSVLFLVVMLLLPLATVISEALRDGWKTYQAAVTDKYTVKAVLLTLEATAIAVGVNTVFGVFAALAVSVPQQESADYADRCAGDHFSDHCRSDLPADIRQTERDLSAAA